MCYRRGGREEREEEEEERARTLPIVEGVRGGRARRKRGRRGARHARVHAGGAAGETGQGKNRNESGSGPGGGDLWQDKTGRRGDCERAGLGGGGKNFLARWWWSGGCGDCPGRWQPNSNPASRAGALRPQPRPPTLDDAGAVPMPPRVAARAAAAS